MRLIIGLLEMFLFFLLAYFCNGAIVIFSYYILDMIFVPILMVLQFILLTYALFSSVSYEFFCYECYKFFRGLTA